MDKVTEYYFMLFHTDNGKRYIEKLPNIGRFNGLEYNEFELFVR
jgi:hypothetical protein